MAIQLQSLSPSNGSSVNSSSVVLRFDYYCNETDTQVAYRFFLSQNANPEVSPVYDSGYLGGYAHGDAVYSNQYFSQSVNVSGLAPGVYYWKVFFVEYTAGFHFLGSPSAVQSFTIVDTPPTVTQSSPAAGASLSWTDSNPYPVTFQWAYTGGTAKYAHQVIVERNSDGLVIADTGKVVSSSNSHVVNIPTTYRDVQLRWRVRVWNQYDTVSTYTANRLFTLATIPTVATQVSPLDNAQFSWSGSSPYSLPIQWSYAGTGAQSAYRIVVERASDGFVVVDTGSVASAATSANVSIPLTYRDVTLRWRMTVANVYGTVSPFTAYRTVKLLSPPSVTITSPTANQVLTTGTPAVSGALTVSASLSVNKIVASLWDGTTKVWEKTVTGTYANGATYSISDTNFFMTPNITYTYRVEATDTQGVVSPTATQNFSVNYTAPVTPGSVTVAVTNYADSGYNSVTFPDTGRDADFYAWEVEREDSLLDHNTGSVLSVGPWKKIGAIYVPNTGGYTFLDYLAPSNHSVRYRVRQVSLKFNTQVYGAYSTSSSNSIFTSVYWLVAGTNGSSSTVSTYKIYIVNSDSYTEETESNTFNLIGRGRYDEKGTSLGVVGQLGVQLRDTTDGTARQKKLALDAFIFATPKATLRNPFGDAYYVSVGNISFTRLPGVGKAEYTDITIPYSEVAF